MESLKDAVLAGIKAAGNSRDFALTVGELNTSFVASYARLRLLEGVLACTHAGGEETHNLIYLTNLGVAVYTVASGIMTADQAIRFYGISATDGVLVYEAAAAQDVSTAVGALDEYLSRKRAPD